MAAVVGFVVVVADFGLVDDKSLPVVEEEHWESTLKRHSVDQFSAESPVELPMHDHWSPKTSEITSTVLQAVEAVQLAEG